jgi:hypothetical protein
VLREEKQVFKVWRADIFDDGRASNGFGVASKVWASDLRDDGNRKRSERQIFETTPAASKV